MIKKTVYIIIIFCFVPSTTFGQLEQMTAEQLIKAMDANLNAKTRIMTSKMIVHGRRSSRTIAAQSARR